MFRFQGGALPGRGVEDTLDAGRVGNPKVVDKELTVTADLYWCLSAHKAALRLSSAEKARSVGVKPIAQPVRQQIEAKYSKKERESRVPATATAIGIAQVALRRASAAHSGVAGILTEARCIWIEIST